MPQWLDAVLLSSFAIFVLDTLLLILRIGIPMSLWLFRHPSDESNCSSVQSKSSFFSCKPLQPGMDCQRTYCIVYIYITTNEESFDDFTFHLIYILLTKLITFTRAYSNTHWFCFWHSPPLQRTFHLKRIAVTKNFILFLTSVARKAVHMWHRFNSICNVLKAIYLEHAPLLQVSSFSVRLVTTAVCAKSTCPTSATISVHCITINIMLLNVGWCATTCIPHEYSDTSQKFCIRSGLASQQHQHSATACKYFCVYMRCGGTCFCIVEYCGILLGFTYYNSYNAEIDESIKSVVIYSIITIFFCWLDKACGLFTKYLIGDLAYQFTLLSFELVCMIDAPLRGEKYII